MMTVTPWTTRLARTVALSACLTAAAEPALAGCLNGVNLAGAEFGDVDGQYGYAYIYPTTKTIDYFADKGFNTIRLPFSWERLQKDLNGPFDADELKRLKTSVADMEKRGMTVVLDPHNYARYRGDIVGSDAVPNAAFADFWEKLAKIFLKQPKVVFGLMNEPHDMPPQQWRSAVDAAVAKIRATGARNLILVPGVAWTGAHSWQNDQGGMSNAQAMAGIKDPTGNYAYDVHQYLDDDFSGTHKECPRGEDAAQALVRMTDWLRANKARGFLGEFGGSQTSDCMIGLARMTDVMAQANDVWIGWTYWAGGEWWSPEEPLNIQPTKDGDRLQIKALTARKLARREDACPALDAVTKK